MFKCLIIIMYSQHLLAIPLNCPYKDVDFSKTTSFMYLSNYPEKLDPIDSYDAERIKIISQIYEPLYTVAYDVSPTKIVPLVAKEMPKVEYLDSRMQPVSVENASYSVYTISLKTGIYYQPSQILCDVHRIKNCSQYQREVQAEDYAYQIKRIAQVDAHSPFASILAKYIVGFKEYQNTPQVQQSGWHDIRSEQISGVKVIDSYTMQITIKHVYQQWLYWLAQYFITPMPWEIDVYDHQHVNQFNWLAESIGSGPYMLNHQMNSKKIELVKNPNFREEYYSFTNGRFRLPMIDKFVFYVEEELIPRWNKFLQGYFDYSSLPSESFQNNIQVQPNGQFTLSDSLKRHHIKLLIEPSAFLSGIVFNFLDPIVGGYDLKQQKLRRAISLAYDFDEFRTIFRAGRGITADGPIPPSVYPDMEKKIGYNHFLYNRIQDRLIKKNLEEAKKLLAEAGYPNGINPKTGRPLVLNFDQISKGLPEEKAYFIWFKKQIAKLGIELNFREDDTNRYNNKLLAADFQLIYNSWGADYPDVESFLILFYGPNHMAQLGGPNKANFHDSQYDLLYEKFITLEDGSERDDVIKQMMNILWQQSVWVWGTHGQTFYLLNDWIKATDFQTYVAGTLKYYQIFSNKRFQQWSKWNQVHYLPMLYFIILMMIIFIPFLLENKKIKHRKAKRTHF
jgi:ABC-type transport system substrate-binding protein